MTTIQSNAFFIGEEETVYPAGEGITRQFIAYDNQIMMVKVMFEKGAIGYSHQHPHVQTTYVVSGKFEATIGDETRVLNAGDGFYAEPDVVHGCVCLEEGVLIDVFNPIREDFYKTI